MRIYGPVLIYNSPSLRPEEIQVDLLGFAYEETSHKLPLFKSPNLQAVEAGSSYSFVHPLQANTIIVGEVTTSILDYDDHALVFLKQVLVSFIVTL
jgi:hypothetical protein